MSPDHVSTTPRKCPSDELLVAAVIKGISHDEQQWLDAHLDTCDRCLDAVGAVMQRLRIADEIPAAVPAAVRQRAAAVTPPPATAPLPRAQPAAPWSAGVRGWLAALLRPPVLIPAAVGMAAIFAVATQTWMAPETPRTLRRSIAGRLQVRITVPEAPVRRQPNRRAEVVATVTRGTPVDVGDEERDWSHVTLPNGTKGWIAREALR